MSGPRRALRALRTRLAQEGGMTLAELMITLSLLLVTTAAFLTVLQSVQTGVIRQQERSMTNDAARLAIQRLDREIRSGNVLYDPAGEALASYSMRIYTQANAPTRNPAFQCVQWKIEDQQLLRRSWPSGRPEEVSGWGLVTDHIVNADLDEPVPAFSLDPDPNKGGRTVDIVLMVNSRPDREVSRPVRIETSLTGRNTSFGFPLDVCDPVPAG